MDNRGRTKLIAILFSVFALLLSFNNCEESAKPGPQHNGNPYEGVTPPPTPDPEGPAPLEKTSVYFNVEKPEEKITPFKTGTYINFTDESNNCFPNHPDISFNFLDKFFKFYEYVDPSYNRYVFNQFNCTGVTETEVRLDDLDFSYYNPLFIKHESSIYLHYDEAIKTKSQIKYPRAWCTKKTDLEFSEQYGIDHGVDFVLWEKNGKFETTLVSGQRKETLSVRTEFDIIDLQNSLSEPSISDTRWMFASYADGGASQFFFYFDYEKSSHKLKSINVQLTNTPRYPIAGVFREIRDPNATQPIESSRMECWVDPSFEYLPEN